MKRRSVFFCLVISISLLSGEIFSQTQSEECAANYKKGAERYNKALKILDSAKASGCEGGESKKLFKEALPYLNKADSLCPAEANNIRAIMNIYYVLNNLEMYNKYKSKLETLKKSAEGNK